MAVGIVAEFNPFHNGHKYLIQTAKEFTGESVVVIMSGSFVQRGGIAVTDKLTRAKAALSNGADLVLELPVTFSHNTAQRFATGAVATLGACGIITSLAFGSESGDIISLSDAAYELANEPEAVSQKIKQLMKEGISYPAARQIAYDGAFDTSVLSTPNDILAVEYLKACLELNLNISPLAIKRTGVDHDSKKTTSSIASASQIRQMLYNGKKTGNFMPYSDFAVYDGKRLDTAVISNLRLSSPEKLSLICDVAEGLENKFIQAAMQTDTVGDLCEAVKSKRYTLSRIRRIAYSSLIGITKDAAALMPSYIRVLGMNENGRQLLRDMKDKADLPIIIKPADYKGDTIFNLNTRAEDIFSLCAPEVNNRCGGNDLRMTPIVME